MLPTSANSSTDRIAATYGLYIDDFQRLFKFHNIYTGHLENFSRLSAALASKPYFSSDFFSLADTILRKEAGNLSEVDLLTIIAFALGGPDVGDASGVNVPMSFLQTFTSGLRAWSEAPIPNEDPIPREVFAPEEAGALPPSSPEHAAPLQGSEGAVQGQHPEPSSSRFAPVSPAPATPGPAQWSAPPPGPAVPGHVPPSEPTFRSAAPIPIPTPPRRQPAQAFQPRPADPVQAPGALPTDPARTSYPAGYPNPYPDPYPTAAQPLPPYPTTAAPPGSPPFAPDPNATAPQPPAPLPLHPRIDGTLERLEITSRQLKDHLESIEQRISRIEPQLEEAATPASLAVPAASVPVAPTIASAPPVLPEPAPRSTVPLTLRHKTDPVAAPASPPVFTSFMGSTPASDSSSDYDEEEENGWPSRSMFVLAFLAILLAAAGAFAYRYYVAHGNLDIRQILHLSSTQAPAPVSAPIPTPATQTNGPPPTSSATSNAHPGSAGTTPSPAASPSAQSSSAPSGPVPVPSGIILRNGISTPRPEYPPSTRAADIQGSVVVDVIISKNGNVQSVHAVSGPQELRPAVMRAVRSWRFKPYEVNGLPVAVSTTFSFSFRSDWIYPTVDSGGPAATTPEAPQR